MGNFWRNLACNHGVGLCQHLRFQVSRYTQILKVLTNGSFSTTVGVSDCAQRINADGVRTAVRTAMRTVEGLLKTQESPPPPPARTTRFVR